MNTLSSTKPVLQSSPAFKNIGIISGIIVAGLIVFLLMWLSVATESLFIQWDEPINEYFLQLRQNAPEWLTGAARIIGKAGSQGITALTIIILTIWAFRRQFRKFWLMFAAVVGVEFLWLPVVFGIGRPRPTEVKTVGDIVLPGFPSGHVMIFIAFFGALLYIYFIEVKSRKWRIAIAAATIASFLLTGFIRLYFNAHYFTDVIAGYALGFAWTAFAVMLVETVYRKRTSKKEQREKISAGGNKHGL